MTMKPDIKAAWLRDLRSGNYEQGRENLEDRANHYCCLGVLGICTLARHRTEVEASDSAELNPEILDEVGLRNEDQAHLINMNDGLEEYKGKPQSFLEIATWIEANL